MFLIGALIDRYGLRLLQDYNSLSIILVSFGLAAHPRRSRADILGQEQPLAGRTGAPGSLDQPHRDDAAGLSARRGLRGVLVATGRTPWLRKTRMGLFVRASSTDPATTALQGVNTDRISAFVVGLGTALAGFAGVVTAPFLSLAPTMGSNVLIDSYMVVVIGGLGSLQGAFLAALVLGQVQLGVVACRKGRLPAPTS
ncbi:Branched-chain amino acid transport system permease protein OS=Castellaniella defragrans OX=75697 GN=HNR28_002067 PE=3 SV=1 [Castellaniella defragrans]